MVDNFINAKAELLEDIEGRKIIAAEITFGENRENGELKTFILKQGHTEADLQQFLTQLDFKYENGYGTQYLFGTVWLDNNQWLDRREYDGSEWWGLNFMPKIREACL